MSHVHYDFQHYQSNGYDCCNASAGSRRDDGHQLGIFEFANLTRKRCVPFKTAYMQVIHCSMRNVQINRQNTTHYLKLI